MGDDDPVLATKGAGTALEGGESGEGLLVNDPVAPAGDRHQLEVIRWRK